MSFDETSNESVSVERIPLLSSVTFFSKDASSQYLSISAITASTCSSRTPSVILCSVNSVSGRRCAFSSRRRSRRTRRRRGRRPRPSPRPDARSSRGPRSSFEVPSPSFSRVMTLHDVPRRTSAASTRTSTRVRRSAPLHAFVHLGAHRADERVGNGHHVPLLRDERRERLQRPAGGVHERGAGGNAPSFVQAAVNAAVAASSPTMVPSRSETIMTGSAEARGATRAAARARERVADRENAAARSGTGARLTTETRIAGTRERASRFVSVPNVSFNIKTCFFTPLMKRRSHLPSHASSRHSPPRLRRGRVRE